jgi:hypothetical protein
MPKVGKHRQYLIELDFIGNSTGGHFYPQITWDRKSPGLEQIFVLKF